MSPKGLHKIGTISRLTGLSPLLLRAWERRHHLLEPERGSGGQRLYTDDDLKVLRRVQSLMESGKSIGEVAAIGRESLLGVPEEALVRAPVVEKTGTEVGSLERQRAEIIRAALTLDAPALNHALDDAAAAVSFPALIDRVIVPAAREIGDLWQAGRCTVASEHLATSIFSHRIRKLIELSEQSPNSHSPLALAACLPGEEHDLGLLILAFHLNRHGVRVLLLGANLPLADLRQAFLSSRPKAVLLSVTRKETFESLRDDLRQLLKTIGKGSYVYVGGLGAPEHDRSLEAAGLRLVPATMRGEETAEKIAHDLISS